MKAMATVFISWEFRKGARSSAVLWVFWLTQVTFDVASLLSHVQHKSYHVRIAEQRMHTLHTHPHSCAPTQHQHRNTFWGILFDSTVKLRKLFMPRFVYNIFVMYTASHKHKLPIYYIVCMHFFVVTLS